MNLGGGGGLNLICFVVEKGLDLPRSIRKKNKRMGDFIEVLLGVLERNWRWVLVEEINRIGGSIRY